MQYLLLKEMYLTLFYIELFIIDHFTGPASEINFGFFGL
jgi:hypothetical protein